MTVDPKLATEVAKIVAKDIYGDAFAPAAREIGAALGDLAHTMRVAGLEFGAISRERVIGIIGRAAAQIPTGRRLLPPPQVLGPVLEGIRYEPDGTPIAAMWEALLARSMDAERLGEAHPAFAGIIRRLSSDEARLLNYLRHTPISGPSVPQNYEDYPLELIQCPADVLEKPESFELYRMNLGSMALIMYRQFKEPVDPATEWRMQLFLLPFGEALIDACTPSH